MISSFQTIDDVWKYLNAIPKFQDKGASAANFELKNISDFCSKLGNPQNEFPSIHVAGTNGKGTTCHLLEAVYSQAGYKTGLFTSPHLQRYNERFRISGEEVSDKKILDFFQDHENKLKHSNLTYFEISTALAFWLFAKERVDIGIIETGLGGRLDSTNIIIPEASIITSIGLDHQDILGNSVTKIAKEKAGIIKDNVPVILANIRGKAKSVISEIAELKKAQVFKASELHPVWDNGLFSLSEKKMSFNTLLKEEVNKWNLAVVYLCTQVLGHKFKISEQDFVYAMSDFKGAVGRFEKLHPEKDWYFSGAHNSQALRSTLETVNSVKGHKKTIIVFAMMRDKMNSKVADLLNEYKYKYFFEISEERSISEKELSKYLKAQIITESTQKSILKEFESSLVIFTGSFYFYSTVKRWVS